jgi:hypothetical protein
MRELFRFPDPVNEVSARLVAAGVVILGSLILVTDTPWLIALLAYGFVARVATGPTLSPLGQLVTRVLTPAMGVEAKLVAGPPKRFAQGIGATLSVAAAAAHFAFGATTVAYVLVGAIVAAASLEAAFAFCLGCRIFGYLVRSGIIPDRACVDCADITRRVAVEV